MWKIEASYTKKIKPHEIGNLIVTALEGGSNYWINEDYEVEFIAPKNFNNYGEYYTTRGGERKAWYYCYPLNEGGAIYFIPKNGEDPPLVFDIDSVQKGLDVLKDYAKHYEWFINDNSDGEVADIFLQGALFGEVIYG